MVMNKMDRNSLRFKLLFVIFLFIFAAGGQRLLSAALSFTFLEKITPFLPYYLMLSGFLWAAAAITTLLELWFNWQNKQRFITISATFIIVLTFWAEHLFLYPGASARVNTPFLTIFSIVGVIIVSTATFLPL
jgi:hypothetical protein